MEHSAIQKLSVMDRPSVHELNIGNKELICKKEKTDEMKSKADANQTILFSLMGRTSSTSI